MQWVALSALLGACSADHWDWDWEINEAGGEWEPVLVGEPDILISK